MSSETKVIPTVDLSAFGPNGDPAARKRAARELRAACSTLGCANLTNIGITPARIEETFAWSKKLFDLPREELMKAPHPPTALPHRGYSSPGVEKVYSKAERDKDEATNGQGAALRDIVDFKESYEVGSEDNSFQPNIWLPEATLPGYRDFALMLYADMHQAAMTVLDALCTALELSDEDRAHLFSVHSAQNNQLRLLHYPPIEAEKLAQKVVGRMPQHQDWSSFTFVFQDSEGGLEFQDPGDPDVFIPAKPVGAACILNVGDMLKIYSNDIFPSAMHRVTLPTSASSAHGGDAGVVGSRYSVPYFVAPDHEAMVSCLPSCVSAERPSRYESVKWCNYGEYMWKHAYKTGASKYDSVNGK